MTPQEVIASLDRALDAAGEDVTLRRWVGTQNRVSIDVGCRAFVRAFRPEQLVGGLTQTDSNVIISPSEIERAQWPSPPSQAAERVPRVNDKVVIQGKERNVSFVKPIYMAGELVRIELTVAG